MEHYVTLFDSLFLPQGLALHASMTRHVHDFRLWILCVDDNTHEVLEKLSLDRVQLLKLSSLETSELLAVKPGRSKGEYCWTLTPFAPRFVFESDSEVERVTYIDADLWFRKDPSPIFKEFDASNKDVLITDHAYAPEQDHSATSGQYCVQFMVFTRNGGELVRKWWEAKCLDWCFARFEDGRFGDQKYLDDWPERFPTEVHVLENKELLLAPWNATRFPYSSAVAWHFHALRIRRSGQGFCAEFGPYPLPKTTRLHVYGGYVKDVAGAIELLELQGVVVQNQVALRKMEVIKAFVKKMAYNFRYSGYAHREKIF